MPDTQAETLYDPDAIFDEHGPIDPLFIADAIQALMRAYPLDTPETDGAQQRHLQSALIALAATNPRDPIEVMLTVQALSAYQAACACWRLGMNPPDPGRDRVRHISAAATAARTFDTMLRAIERRQVKPLAIPTGRPVPRTWSRDKTVRTLNEIADRVRRIDEAPEQSPPPNPPVAEPPVAEPPVAKPPVAEPPVVDSTVIDPPVIDPLVIDPPVVDPTVIWTQEDLAFADQMLEKERIEKDNEGLDIANTDGILPGGGMILMDEPTPQQAAYMGRRLGLMYRREYEESLRKGIREIPRIRPIRPGDLIP